MSTIENKDEGRGAEGGSGAEKLEPELQAKRELFESVVASFGYRDAANASREERRQRGWDDSSLVYGEIEFPTFASILKEVKQLGGLQGRGIFTDLGSGTGKAVFAAALLHPFDKCRGVEILDSLHDTAQRFLGLWNERVVPKLTDGEVPAIELEKGDALAEDLSATTLLYLGATCFSDELFAKFAEKAKAMKPGSYAVTLSVPLPENEWERLVTDAPFTMSWGSVSVFIHRRRGDEGDEGDEGEEQE